MSGISDEKVAASTNGNTQDPDQAVHTEPSVSTDAPPWANLIFPEHWDAYLKVITQPIFQSGFSNPGFFAAAVRDATLYLETRLRDLCDSPNSEIGLDLVSYAFKHDNLEGYLLNPRIVPAEAQGIHSLFRGAVLQIRNPVGHRYVSLRAVEVFDIIALVNYLSSTAQDLSKERFLYPFVPRWDAWRNLLATRRVDLNSDGRDEIIVLFNEGRLGEAAQGRFLVLTDDATRSLPGQLPTMKGYFSPLVIAGDVDGDARQEVLISFYGENNIAHGVLVDFDASTNELRTVTTLDGNPLQSNGQPFEIKADGSIVAYGADGKPIVARLNGNDLAST